MQITNEVFEKLLANNSMTKKEFSLYSKISYSTVTGWKKKNQVPPYAMVILKDMIYRKRLDIETAQSLGKVLITNSKEVYSLSPNEENKLRSAFWGTNYTTSDIVKKIRQNDQNTLKRVQENLPLELHEHIVGKLLHA